MATAIYAENEPAISVKAEVTDEERSLSFVASVKGIKLGIDWGDGVIVETDEIATSEDEPSITTVIGTPKGDGTIKIYGDKITVFECPSTVSGAKIKSIDVTKATGLKELTVNTNAIENLDISKNTELESLVCYGNPIETLDISNNTKLDNLDAKDLQISEIDISKCPLLKTLYLNNNSKITTLDISQNENLENLYIIGASLTEIDLSKAAKLKALSVNNNKLTKLDASACTQIATLFCMGNNISELIIPETIKTTLNCSGNRLNFSTLPVTDAKNYIYAPQQNIELESEIKTGTELDLSYLDNIKGFAETEQKTTFVWKSEDGLTTLEEGIDYKVENGVFTFLKKQENIYCEMTTPAFPKFSDKNILKTSVINVEEGTSISMTDNDMVIVYSDSGKIIIDNPTDNKHISVYRLDGTMAIKLNTKERKSEISIEKGVYLVTVNGKTYKVGSL